MRYVLDFGPDNANLTPPSFAWFRDAATHVDLPKPTIYQSGGAALTYYFDYDLPNAVSPDTSSVEYGVTLGGVGLTDTLSIPGYTPTRFYLDFGILNGQLTPPTFTWYRDPVTAAAITPPALVANTLPAWNYWFDATFPGGILSIEYGITLAGVELTDVIDAPALVPGAGGSLTLAQLRDLIRQESDTEDDPHITDTELTGWINRSRFRLYGKLVTSFGDDYYSAKATITVSGSALSVPLPDGVLYGGAQPFFKGLLLEAISGGGATSDSPITLLTFNLREKNRFGAAYTLAVPEMFPRYRIVGSNIEFNARPTGMVMQAWYAPRLAILVNETDVADDWNGWLDLVVLDCAIKAVGKQERDASLLVARKNELLEELNHEIANRNIGDANTVALTGDDFDGVW